MIGTYVEIFIAGMLVYNAVLLRRLIEKSSKEERRSGGATQEDIQSTLNDRLFEIQKRRYSVQQRRP